MKRKWILTILTVTLFAVLLAFPVSAETVSGTCGDKLTWTFDSATGVLTISGQGNMNSVPWNTLQRSIVQVVINEGCTELYQKAFANCSNLTAVSLPASLEKIGDGAFMYCSQLKTVTFPDKLTAIGRNAFNTCMALTSVTIPDSVKTVGDGAFAQCTKLVEINLGNGLEELGSNVFSSCSRLKSLRIPDKVTAIKNSLCYKCNELEEVIIGAGVSEINSQAFRDCFALSAFTLSSKNKSFIVDRGVLYTKDKMELVLMPKGFYGDYTVLPGTTKILTYACEGTNLTAVTIPASVTEIESYAFNNCEVLEKVNFPEGLQKIDTRAFCQTGLEEIKIPKSVTRISGLAFGSCQYLEKITFEGAPPEFGDAPFQNVSATIYYPGGFTEWNAIQKDFPYTIQWEPYFCNLHSPTVVSAVTATCEKTGLTAGSRCSVCGKVLEEQKEIPKTAHRFGPWQSTDVDMGDGIIHKYRLCSDCLYMETKNLSDKDVATEPTQSQPTTPTQPQPTTPTQPQPTTPNPTVEQESTEPVAPTVPAETTQGDALKDTEATGQTEPESTEQEPQKTKKRKGLLWGILVSVVIVALLGVRVWLWYR